MGKARLILFALILSLLTLGNARGGPEESLLQKGFSPDIVKGLNPLCLSVLDQRVPKGVPWYATFDRATGSLAIDFQTPDKVQHSLLITPVGDDRCTVYHVAVYLVQNDLEGEKQSWMEGFKANGVQVEITEDTAQRVTISGTGNSGLKLYLYPMGGFTLGVFRNFQSLTFKAP